MRFLKKMIEAVVLDTPELNNKFKKQETMKSITEIAKSVNEIVENLVSNRIPKDERTKVCVNLEYGNDGRFRMEFNILSDTGMDLEACVVEVNINDPVEQLDNKKTGCVYTVIIPFLNYQQVTLEDSEQVEYVVKNLLDSEKAKFIYNNLEDLYKWRAYTQSEK